jgi:hypothetical protein
MMRRSPMPRPDKQINSVVFWRPQVLEGLVEVTSRDNCYFPGAERVVIFFQYTGQTGTLDIDMLDGDGNWMEIQTESTAAGVNVIAVEHGLWGPARLRLRFTPTVGGGTLAAYGTGFPTVMTAPNVRENKLGSYTSGGSTK